MNLFQIVRVAGLQCRRLVPSCWGAADAIGITMTYKLIVILSIVAISLAYSGCKPGSSIPTTPNEIVIKIDTVFLSYDSLWTIGGPGFYSKTITISNFHFDPLWGDSAVKTLLDSNIDLVEFWYPATVGIAHNPFLGMIEIAKLNQSDTAIYHFGYAPLDTVIFIHCTLVRQFRHYSIVSQSAP
jgi:hypothetical protein